MGSLSTANVEFCLDLYKQLNSNNAGDNIFFSPLSLLYALNMILLGARGYTGRQIEKVINARKTTVEPECLLYVNSDLLNDCYLHK